MWAKQNAKWYKMHSMTTTLKLHELFSHLDTKTLCTIQAILPMFYIFFSKLLNLSQNLAQHKTE